MEKDNKILGGILGIIAGFVFSIPWLLCYIYLNIITSYLAFVIGYGVYFGYKLVNSKVYKEKGFCAYLLISSIIVVLVDTLVIMPIIMILKGGNKLSFDYVMYLYSYRETSAGIIRDALIGTLFTVIGVLPVYNGLNLKDAEKGNSKTKKETYENKLDSAKEDVKKIFEKYNAFDKNSAVSKDIIKKEIKELSKTNKNVSFSTVDMMKGIVIKKGKKGTWYYDESKDANFSKTAKSILISCIIVGVIAGLSSGLSDTNISSNTQKEGTKSNISSKNVKLTSVKLKDNVQISLPENMFVYNEEENKDSNCYTYVYLPQNVNELKISFVKIFLYHDEYSSEAKIEDLLEYYKTFDLGESEKTVELTLTDYNAIYWHIEAIDKSYSYDVYVYLKNNKLYEFDIDFDHNEYDEDLKTLSNNIASSIKFNIANS